MDGFTAVLSGLLWWASGLLPVDRRRWGEAVWADAADLPRGRERLSWLAGGLWLVVREADVIRRIGYAVAGLAAGAVLVWWNWHPGSANPAMTANRLALVGALLVLVLLPWVARPVLGPVAGNRPARVVRIVGYVALYLLLLVLAGLSRFAGGRFDHFHAFDQRNWEADMRAGAVVSAIVLIVIVGSYATAVLALTARRTAVAPAILTAGAGSGVAAALILYALMPLGNALHPGNPVLAAGYRIVLLLAPVCAMVALAGRAFRGGHANPAGARLAGLCAGATAALLLGIVTIATMLLFPRQVDLEWANPDPTVAHGTPFEVRMSVGDAALKYELGLVLGPLAGLLIGSVAGAARRESTDTQRTPEAEPITTR
jgi:hypothetical protein